MSSASSIALEKGLPTNLDAERSCWVHSDGRVALPHDRGVLEADDFSLEKHRRIFKRMGGLRESAQKIDRITLANELMRYGELESCDGLSYLVSLDDGLPQIFNVESYVRIVKDKALLRRIIFASQEMMNRALLGEEAPGTFWRAPKRRY